MIVSKKSARQILSGLIPEILSNRPISLYQSVFLNSGNQFCKFPQVVAGRLASSFTSTALVSTKHKVDRPNSKRSGSRRSVSRQILLAALAVRRRPVFEIVA